MSTDKTLSMRRYYLLLVIAGFITGNTYSQVKNYHAIAKDVSNCISVSREEATEYLTKNISGKSTFDGVNIQNFDQLFKILEDIQKVRKIDNDDSYFQAKMDSLIEVYGSPEQLEYNIVKDSGNITKDFLQENLDYAFKVKAEKSWLKNIPAEVFFEYILPYRVATERLEEHQRAQLYTTYNFLDFKDGNKQVMFNRNKYVDELKFAADVEYAIAKRISTNRTMWEYPFDISISKMEIGKQGSCRHLVNYTTAAMRSVGLPVASDFTIRWGNHWTGHKWNVLILENGRELPFDAGNKTLTFDMKGRKVVKVYREQFSEDGTFLSPPEADVPSTLYSAYWKDVTKNYSATVDVTIEVPTEVAGKKQYVLIGTFNNSNWDPQFFARIEHSKATFKNMGIDNAYIGMYLDGEKMKTFGDPFLVDSIGHIKYITSSKKLIVQTLSRKYPRTAAVKFYESTMVGGKIEYASDDSFSDGKIGFTVKDIPDSVVKTKVIAGNFRYVRYTFPDSARVYVAEITLIKNGTPLTLKPLDSEKKPDYIKINDLNLNSYYWGEKGRSITYDLGEVTSLESVNIVPRSDSNFIVEGDEYELCYWKDDGWVSSGKKIASSSTLRFAAVPEDAIYILHDLTKGKEERIFTYEAGKQIWW